MNFPMKPPMWAPGIRQGHPLAVRLEGFWPMWEGSGDRVMDVSPNGHHGTMHNMDSGNWGAAPFGPQLDFDGANEFIDCGSPNALRGGLLSGCTISVLANYDNPGDALYPLVASCAAGAAHGYYLAVYQDDLRMQWSDAAAYARAHTSNKIATDEWLLLTGTYDGNEIELYVNGLQQSLALELAGSGAPTWADSVTIGARDSGAADWWDGQIGAAWIHSRALSAGEIAELAYDPWGLITPRRLF